MFIILYDKSTKHELIGFKSGKIKFTSILPLNPVYKKIYRKWLYNHQVVFYNIITFNSVKIIRNLAFQ